VSHVEASGQEIVTILRLRSWKIVDSKSML